MKNQEYEKYIHSSAWRKKAEARLEHDNHRCCVCGKEATDVHHLTYDNFRHEHMDDLVSLCRSCHQKAEEIYDPSIIPWSMDEVLPTGNSFMIAMRLDAQKLAPIVFDYLKEVRGISFDALMGLRQPADSEGKKYWGVLREAVVALCKKRYSRNCVEDRMDLMVDGITNHITAICLSQIEHDIRNQIQAELHETVELEYAILEKWKSVAGYLGISNGTLTTLRKDNGSSFGPTLREVAFYYCSLDAAAGIEPPEFSCLTPEDKEQLRAQAVYAAKVMEEMAV